MKRKRCSATALDDGITANLSCNVAPYSVPGTLLAAVRLMEVLLQAARCRPDAAAMHNAAAAVRDWEETLALATRHGVVPLLCDRLSRYCGNGAPKAVVAQLRRAFHANAARNTVMAWQLKTIMGWLEEGGVPAIAFKGPTLAAWVYGDVALREFSDLDILIPRAHLRSAVSILSSNRCVETGAEGAGDLGGNFEIGLRTENGCAVDLHWDVSPPYLPPLDLSTASQRLQRVALDGGSVPTLSPDDTFRVLALHGARHCWFSLSWISDVAHLVEKTPLDWEPLLRDRRMGRMHKIAVLLATDMLGATIPSEVAASARRDRVALALARLISENIFTWTGDIAGTPRGALMHLQMMTTLRDRWRYLWRRGFQANQTDNDRLSLPRQLRPLLYAARPFRILTKLMSRS